MRNMKKMVRKRMREMKRNLSKKRKSNLGEVKNYLNEPETSDIFEIFYLDRSETFVMHHNRLK